MTRPVKVSVDGKSFPVVPGTFAGLEPDPRDPRRGTVRIDGERLRYTITPDPQDPGTGRIQIGLFSLPFSLDASESTRSGGRRGGPDPTVRAHMPGLLVKLAVAPGDTVEPGTLLAVLEAMKMQNEIRSRVRGTVRAVHAAAGASLEGGAPLVTVDPA